MQSLVLATSVFLALHFLVAGTPLRAAIARLAGEKVYQAVFFIAAILTLVWLVTAFGQAPREALWMVPGWLYWPYVILILIACIFIAAGLTIKNPTGMGMDKLLDKDAAVTGFLRITRHPMNMGVALWALVHILQTGDSASLILFGGLFVLAALGPRGIDAKRQQAYGEHWGKFADQTSYIPFAAILSGRNNLVWGELGWWRIALGVVLFAALYYVHGQISGIELVLPF